MNREETVNRTISVFDTNAELYLEKYHDLSAYSSTLDALLENLKGNKVLDLACGPGHIAHYLHSKNQELELTLADLSNKMLDLAKEANPEATLLQSDAREIKKLGKDWDGILISFCFPYLTKEECLQLIQDAGSCLNKGGVLYLSTMTGNYEEKIYDGTKDGPIPVYYHQADYLLNELKLRGFTLLIEKYIPETLVKDSKDINLLLLARKD